MREKIILAPGANQSELLRTLARFGKNQFNTRILNSIEFSKLALTCSGIAIDEEFITRQEEPSLIASFIRLISYFKVASYSDAEQIADALYSIRMLITENENETIENLLSKGEFQDKNDAIILCYKKYISACKERKKIDSIGLIRKAIGQVKEIDADFIRIEEYSLTPLEEYLLKKVSGNNIEVLNMNSLFETEICNTEVESFTEAYGSSNEVETIIGHIYENNLPLDCCTVAVTDVSEYSQLFYDLCCAYNIPVTFGCGVPISNSNPAKLLKLFLKWNTSGYNSINSLTELLYSNAFNRKEIISGLPENINLNNIIEMAGSLRLSCDNLLNKQKIENYRKSLPDDSSEEKILDCAENLFSYFEEGIISFLKKFTVIRSGNAGRIDRSAIQVIDSAISNYLSFSQSDDINYIISEILNKSVCSENSREGCLHITGISGAKSVIRENLYVAGLSSSLFPGTPTENHLILDSDYNLFGKSETLPTSDNKVNIKKQQLKDLLRISSSLGNKNYLSYSGFNLSDIKENNPSSVLFEIFKEQHGDTKTIGDFNNSVEHTGFFQQRILPERLIGKQYLKSSQISFSFPKKDKITVSCNINQSFSPTAIEMYFNCPRKFLFKRILNIPEPDENNPFDVIKANEFGNIIHDLMKYLADNKVSKEEFLNLAKQKINNYFCKCPPLHEYDAQNEKETFLSVAAKAYETNSDNKVISSEEKYTAKHPLGVILSGRVDRVEKDRNGNYIIVDYKTGKKIKHIQDDIDSCLQAVLYAYMLKQNGIDISSCEYRYLRYGKTVKCEYNETVEAKLSAKLFEFKKSLDEAVFLPCSDCRNCGYTDICIKNSSEEEKTNE